MTRLEANYNRAWHGLLRAAHEGNTARCAAYRKLIAALWNERVKRGELP